MNYNKKKPNTPEKRIIDKDISQIKKGKMSNLPESDYIKIGRQAWAKAVDQPVVHPIDDDLIREITNELNKLIDQGESYKFIDYLDSHVPNWMNLPNNAKILYRVAVAHKYNDNFEKAESFYLKAYNKFIELDDMNGVSDSLQELSLCAVALRNDIEQGWEYLEKAAKAVIDESNWGAYINRVCFASTQKNDEHLAKALHEFEKVVPGWHENMSIVRLFKTDAELEYLRNNIVLWSKINSKMKGENK